MSTKPLAEAYEKLKELRRLGGESTVEIPSSIGDYLFEWSPELMKIYDNLSLAPGKPDRSANLIRALEIKTLADRIFGDEQNAESWLHRPNASLSGQKPIDLLKDELGAAVIREMLERIDHGIFA